RLPPHRALPGRPHRRRVDLARPRSRAPHPGRHHRPPSAPRRRPPRGRGEPPLSGPPPSQSRPFHEDFHAEATFSDLALEAADLSEKEFQRCLFRRCKLPESRWVRARLEDCVFEECDLTRVAPQQLGLRGVTFKGTKLMGVDWTELA